MSQLSITDTTDAPRPLEVRVLERPAAEAPRGARALITLIRPKQWVKNGFVVAPLLFSREFTQLESLQATAIAVGYFCVVASATYVLNDLHDRERDRRHPTKSLTRPIAAGTVSVRSAIVLLVVLYAVAATSILVEPMVALILAAYTAINVLYSWRLKHQPVVDIFTIAAGFVLRVIAGSFAIQAPISSWMCITVLCLALYLAAVKRRQEFRGSGSAGRASLDQYTGPLIERYAEMSATGALVFYSMFVLTVQTHLAFTVPIVIFGLFRYWYVVERHGRGESPTEALLRDWQLIATVCLWVGGSAWALWPVH